jgi:hypothetical protein
MERNRIDPHDPPQVAHHELESHPHVPEAGQVYAVSRVQ